MQTVMGGTDSGRTRGRLGVVGTRERETKKEVSACMSTRKETNVVYVFFYNLYLDLLMSLLVVCFLYTDNKHKNKKDLWKVVYKVRYLYNNWEALQYVKYADCHH